MKRIFVLAALGLAFVIASVTYVSAEKFENNNLHGEYLYVGSRLCMYSNDGFSTSSNFALLSPGSSRVANFKGVLRLNKDGTGTNIIKTMQVNPHQTGIGQKPVSVWEVSCDVEHERLPDGTIGMRFLYCEGSYQAGGGVPGTTGIDEIVLSGEVSTSKQILLLSDTEPRVETFWSLPEGETVKSYGQRLCTRTFTAFRR